MKESERLAAAYLDSLGLDNVIYEPDGQITPDFLVNGNIAIEVRLLNQNEVTESGSSSGLETLRLGLLKTMKEVLASLGPSTGEESWFVSYTFRRPVLPRNQLKRAVIEALSAFRDGYLSCTTIPIDNHFELNLIPSSKKFPDHFVLGGYVDRDQGGWLIPNLERNIQVCLREKNEKRSKVREKYPQWWLLLIDYIGYGTKETLNIEHDWDKIILVNPLDPKKAYEL